MFDKYNFLTLFGLIWPKKIRIFSLRWNLASKLITICSPFLVLDRKYLFWANLVQKIKIACLRWNLEPELIPVFWIQRWYSFSLLWTGKHISGKFGPINQNCLFKMKFGIWINSNMLNSMVMFTLSVLDQKYNFWENLVQKIKMFCARWNLAHRLIQNFLF